MQKLLLLLFLHLLDLTLKSPSLLTQGAPLNFLPPQTRARSILHIPVLYLIPLFQSKVGKPNETSVQEMTLPKGGTDMVVSLSHCQAKGYS